VINTLHNRGRIMSYDISYDEKENIIQLHFFGIDTKDEHYAALDEACQICTEYNCKKLLVDLSEMEIKPILRNVFGCFQFGDYVSKKMVGFKIAHVMPKIVTDVKDVQFISNVEHNRGVNCREFLTIEDALQWLK